MKKYLTCTFYLMSCFYCFGQSSDFVIVSSSSNINKSGFTVGEIFVAGQNTSGFLASHFQKTILVSINEIDSEESQSKLIVYPNPTVDFIQFDRDVALLIDKRMMIYSSNGKMVLDQKLKSNSISISSLKSGTYIIKIEGYEDIQIVVLND